MAQFFDNWTGTQKMVLVIVVLLIAVKIVFPEVADWAWAAIEDMTHHLTDAARDLGG